MSSSFSVPPASTKRRERPSPATETTPENGGGFVYPGDRGSRTPSRKRGDFKKTPDTPGSFSFTGGGGEGGGQLGARRGELPSGAVPAELVGDGGGLGGGLSLDLADRGRGWGSDGGGSARKPALSGGGVASAGVPLGARDARGGTRSEGKRAERIGPPSGAPPRHGVSPGMATHPGGGFGGDAMGVDADMTGSSSPPTRRFSEVTLDLPEEAPTLETVGPPIEIDRPASQMNKPPRKSGGNWTPEEDAALRVAVDMHGGRNWKKIAIELGNGRTDVQCLHRWNKVLKPGLVKGPWLKEEDDVVREMVTRYGVGNVKWSVMASKLPGRIGKQCRERWFNHLDPSIKKGGWKPEEDVLIFQAQAEVGNKWCEIARLLPGRTENAVKNRWNSAARRRWYKEAEADLERDPRVDDLVEEIKQAEIKAAAEKKAAQLRAAEAKAKARAEAAARKKEAKRQRELAALQKKQARAAAKAKSKPTKKIGRKSSGSGQKPTKAQKDAVSALDKFVQSLSAEAQAVYFRVFAAHAATAAARTSGTVGALDIDSIVAQAQSDPTVIAKVLSTPEMVHAAHRAAAAAASKVDEGSGKRSDDADMFDMPLPQISTEDDMLTPGELGSLVSALSPSMFDSLTSPGGGWSNSHSDGKDARDGRDPRDGLQRRLHDLTLTETAPGHMPASAGRHSPIGFPSSGPPSSRSRSGAPFNVVGPVPAHLTGDDPKFEVSPATEDFLKQWMNTTPGHTPGSSLSAMGPVFSGSTPSGMGPPTGGSHLSFPRGASPLTSPAGFTPGMRDALWNDSKDDDVGGEGKHWDEDGKSEGDGKVEDDGMVADLMLDDGFHLPTSVAHSEAGAKAASDMRLDAAAVFLSELNGL